MRKNTFETPEGQHAPQPATNGQGLQVITSFFSELLETWDEGRQPIASLPGLKWLVKNRQARQIPAPALPPHLCLASPHMAQALEAASTSGRVIWIVAAQPTEGQDVTEGIALYGKGFAIFLDARQVKKARRAMDFWLWRQRGRHVSALIARLDRRRG